MFSIPLALIMPDTSELLWKCFLPLFFHTSCGNELQLRIVSSIFSTGEKHSQKSPKQKHHSLRQQQCNVSPRICPKEQGLLPQLTWQLLERSLCKITSWIVRNMENSDDPPSIKIIVLYLFLSEHIFAGLIVPLKAILSIKVLHVFQQMYKFK